MKLKIYIILFFAISVNYAQNRNYIKTIAKGTEVKVQVTDGVYYFKAYSDKIIETTFVPKKQKRIKNSHAVVLNTNQPFIVAKNKKTVDIKTKGINIKINKKPFAIHYYYKGKLLISERNGYQKKENEILDFSISKDEILYGGGARALGMNRRGYRLQLYNKAHYGYETHSELMNYTLPLFFSSKKYAIHFDNAAIGYLDLDSKKDNSVQYETISGAKRYQIIASNVWNDLFCQYTNLTGKQPMLPRWVLGNFSSRFGYHSQKEVLQTIQAFKTEKIPVDAVILDLYWFGKTIKETIGNLEFDKDSFPTPKQMIKDLKKQGVKTILITEPFILTTSKKWKEAVEKDILGKNKNGKPYTYDFYFGNTGIIDIFNPKGKQWFWNIYEKYIKDYGVHGWWGDLGEPEVHPSDLLHATGTADEVHNIYGHQWAKLVYKGYEKHFPKQRPFILMRAGYSGTQHYGIVPWSGDVNRTWGGLQSQPEIALQMGMQGLAYMHSDLGGFAGANLDDELYVRWLQYGVFQPIYRPHAQEEVPSEPVFRNKKAKELAKKAIELRYQLLPYNYQLMFANHKYGTPLMRPIFTDILEQFTLKNSLLTYSNAYLWGNDILVSPVLEKGKQKQKVYFPNNANWFNFYTNKKIKGGQTKEVILEEDKIPTYVRGGAFIAMSKPIQNTEEYNANTWNVHYYYDEKSIESYSMFYNDDGVTSQAYKKGLYENITFKAKQTKRHLNINLKAEIGKNYTSQNKVYTFIIHGLKKAPKSIKIKNKRLNFLWQKELKTLNFEVIWNTEKNQKIKIKI